MKITVIKNQNKLLRFPVYVANDLSRNMGRKLAIYKERSLHDTSCPHLSAWCVWFTADTCKWSFPTSLALIRQEELWRVQTIAYVRMTSYRTYKWTLTNTIMVFGIKPDISKCLTLLEILGFLLRCFSSWEGIRGFATVTVDENVKELGKL